jgi:hypothetical protein
MKNENAEVTWDLGLIKLGLGIAFYNQKFIVFHTQVALIIHKIIDRAFFSRVNAGKKSEIKTFRKQLISSRGKLP